MKRTALMGMMLAAALAVGCKGLQPGAGLDDVGESVTLLPEDVAWDQAPDTVPAGAELAVLEGDPSAAEPFVIRLRMPDGYHIPAHSHPHAERVTVIEGTMHLAMGDQLDRDAAVAYPPGSFVAIPVGKPHQVWVEDQTIFQVTGVGPLVVNYIDPLEDPRHGQGADTAHHCPLCQLAAGPTTSH